MEGTTKGPAKNAEYPEKWEVPGAGTQETECLEIVKEKTWTCDCPQTKRSEVNPTFMKSYIDSCFLQEREINERLPFLSQRTFPKAQLTEQYQDSFKNTDRHIQVFLASKINNGNSNHPYLQDSLSVK